MDKTAAQSFAIAKAGIDFIEENLSGDPDDRKTLYSLLWTLGAAKTARELGRTALALHLEERGVNGLRAAGIDIAKLLETP